MRKLAALRNRSPFAGDQPLDSISLCVYGDSTGLRNWNGNNDPMPIKTLNNNGLKVYEETEGYFIQIDKDAVITTVEKYVPGTFDIYNERLKDVEKSRELLTLHKITWDANIDNAKLLLDINKEQLEKLANTPTLLEDEEMPVLETRAIPTNYECCVRIDKKTGEMYIDEWYENLFYNIAEINSTWGMTGRNLGFDNNGVQSVEVSGTNIHTDVATICNQKRNALEGMFSYSLEIEKSDFMIGIGGQNILTDSNAKGTFTSSTTGWSINLMGMKGFTYNKEVAKARVQITKNSTEKPYVKTIMPSGKMEFLSSVTELTHTFLTKGDGVITFGSGSFSLRGEKVKQLLVYKALLTEEQKQAELAKDIKLK